MTRRLLFLILLPVPLYAQQPADEVNTMIGTSWIAGTFPGATRPWGMVSVSPHNTYDSPAGYWSPVHVIRGFGHLHLSGPGCIDMGDIELMPTTGPVEIRPRLYGSSRYHSQEEGTAGYYRVRLDRYDITAEMTATPRCGISRYTFPAGADARVILNVTSSIVPSRGGDVRVVSSSEAEGWNMGGDFCGTTVGRRIYFVMRLGSPADAVSTWRDSALSSAMHATGTDVGALFTWRPVAGRREVVVKVGISYVSIANARLNLDVEATGWDFDSYRSQARDEWNSELGKIGVEGGTPEKRTIFYTALYHSLLHPNILNDVNGQYPKFEHPKVSPGAIGVADGYTRYTLFGLWGTYRTLHPLLTLVWPKQQTDMARSMVEMYRERGWLPVFELSGFEAHSMVGDPATAVLVDTWTKGLRGFDIATAYEAMLKSANQETGAPPVRFDVERYKRLGYVPMHDPRHIWFGSASATLEYAYADWHLARLAGMLGHTADSVTLGQRSGNYRNLYDPSTGFFRPRNEDGSWYSPFDPLAMSQNPDYLYDKGGAGGAGYNEGNAWHHLFMVPHDIAGLAALVGGEKILVQKLQLFFTMDQWIWNENDYGHPYIFTYFPGEEWRAVREIHRLSEEFTAGHDGLPGNEDTGSLSAWYVFNALGFYPFCTGSGEYRIGTPFFQRIVIDLDSRYYPGDRLTIVAPGISDRAIYAQTVSLNDTALPRRAVSHQALVGGGELHFHMSESREVSSRVKADEQVDERIGDIEIRYSGDVNVSFTLRAAGHTRVSIYDMLGARQAVLVDERLGPGGQRVVWSPGSFSGRYLCVIESGGAVVTRLLGL